MQDLKYHVVQPENKKDVWEDYETVDFKISGLGRNLIGGSVRLLGEIDVNNNYDISNNTYASTIVSYDSLSGLHCIVDNVKTSFSNFGQVENCDHYSRFVASKARATLKKEDTFNSVYACEGRTPDDNLSNKLLKGLVQITDDNQPILNTFIKSKLDFACKLDFCLNNMLGNNLLSLNKTGDIIISLQTSKVVQALFGVNSIGIDQLYKLYNLRLVYSSVADDGKKVQNSMRVKASLKQSLQSTFSNISTKVPLVADSFFMSFIQQAHENDPVYNSAACEKIPLFQKLEITWNDNLSQQFTYAIDNEEEVLTNAIKAVSKVAGDNEASLSKLAANDGYLMGLSFGSFVDLSKSKLGINIQSGIDSNVPYNVYMFFNGVLTI